MFVSQIDCITMGGTFLGTFIDCSPNPCPQPEGACCFSDATCAVLAAEQCALQGGSYQGDNTLCSGVTCQNAACPGEGGCFFNNGTPGCTDPECCALVCAIDPFCCNTSWDSACASVASSSCDDFSASCSAGAGPCDLPNSTPGCDDSACCASVCLVDPFCCDVQWDDACVDGAVALCPSVFDGACCLPAFICVVATASECAAEGGVYQGDGTFCGALSCIGACCLPDGSCLDLPEGDCLVSGGAFAGFGTTCTQASCPNDACPGTGLCFVGNGSPGCQNEQCCNAVCASDPFCCDVEWDSLCGETALMTPACVPTVCGPNAGPCDVANGTPGCDNPECCTVICDLDPFCCEVEWDSVCVEEAALTAACGFAEERVCCTANGFCVATDAVILDLYLCTSFGGTLQDAGVTCFEMPCTPCPWDCVPPPFGNGAVNIDDLLAVINAFGGTDDTCDNAPDNGDGTFGNGVINIDDLLGVINNFGDCP